MNMSETIEIGQNDLLLIIDVQNDFCPTGTLPVPDGDQVVAPINALGQKFSQSAMSQDWHPKGHSSFASTHKGKQPFETTEMPYGTQVLWPDHCINGTTGADFHSDLDTTSVQMIVRKGFRPEIDSYSAFYENDKTTPTGLSGYLSARGITRIFVVGLVYEFCVGFSALDGRKEGLDVFIVQDCTGTFGGDGEQAMTDDLIKAGAKIIQAADIK
jgi:nicotinamidase/pyrazinamidase